MYESFRKIEKKIFKINRENITKTRRNLNILKILRNLQIFEKKYERNLKRNLSREKIKKILMKNLN